MPGYIPLLTFEAQLKRFLRSHLKTLGFVKQNNGYLKPPADNKHAIRVLHHHQRMEKLKKEHRFLLKYGNILLGYFANGEEIDPQQIRPQLILVKPNTTESRLFRFATLLWSIPVSNGYGRRIRFLVIDKQNNRLIGLFALGDPVFNLNARDRWVNWNARDRQDRLINVMDCYVLGAVPPYNMLLSTKMIACMVRSREVFDAYIDKYSQKKGIISKKNKFPNLVLVTTTSALGRSSVYNRLRLNGNIYFKKIGLTSGWGHFHVNEELYVKFREYLSHKGHHYANNNRFGDGPNWKLRTARVALEMLGFDPNILCHGVLREVYACEFAHNTCAYLNGTDDTPYFDHLNSYEEIANWALSRWIIPRSNKLADYKMWDSKNIVKLITDGQDSFMTNTITGRG